jgi:hypothetical protein
MGVVRFLLTKVFPVRSITTEIHAKGQDLLHDKGAAYRHEVSPVVIPECGWRESTCDSTMAFPAGTFVKRSRSANLGRQSVEEKARCVIQKPYITPRQATETS